MVTRILILLLLAVSVNEASNGGYHPHRRNQSRPKGGGGGSPELQHEVNGAADGWQNWTPTYTKIGQQFTTGAQAFTVTSIDAKLFELGTVAAGNIWYELWTDDGGSGAAAKPLALVGSASNSRDRTAINTSYGDFATFTGFTGSSPTLAANTKYWIVLASSAVDTDTSNCIIWIQHAGSLNHRGSTGGDFTDDLNTFNTHFRLHGTDSP